MSAIGFGRADLGEQGQCLLPVGQGGVCSLCAQRVAEDEQGVGLAEAVAGVALDGQGLPGMFDGLMGLVSIELDAGQGGQPWPSQLSGAGLAARRHRLAGVRRAPGRAAGRGAGGRGPDRSARRSRSGRHQSPPRDHGLLAAVGGVVVAVVQVDGGQDVAGRRPPPRRSPVSSATARAAVGELAGQDGRRPASRWTAARSLQGIAIVAPVTALPLQGQRLGEVVEGLGRIVRARGRSRRGWPSAIASPVAGPESPGRGPAPGGRSRQPARAGPDSGVHEAEVARG